MANVNPVMLCIMDGWGLRADPENNAVLQAKTPTADMFSATCAQTTLLTSGENVGLPDGQMGNSEVGHMNLGAGRIVYQDLLRIDLAVRDGSFFENPVILESLERAKQGGGKLHLMGLVSDGGVHSSKEHLYALLKLTHQRGLDRVYVHAFTDGRDTPPQSGLGFVSELQQRIEQLAPSARIASVCGRYYAMDRDKRWDRVKLAWDVLCKGRSEFQAESAAEAVQQAYDRDESDEFIKPTVCLESGHPIATIEDGDVIFFFNFRSDRARQLTMLLALDHWPEQYPDEKRPDIAHYATMTRYHQDYPFPVAFPRAELTRILGEVVAERGLAQLRSAETEKFPHVTFFFNGGEDRLFPGEERIMVPSPRDVATYDEKPEMSARGVADGLLDAIRSERFALIICNFANPDMVGHCGKLGPAITAVETVDGCVGELYQACKEHGMTMLVTADHGNCETMVDPETGGPHTAHTTNPVPLWLVGERWKNHSLRPGILADIAPTILHAMGLPQPDEMTGGSLIVEPA